MTFQEFYRSIRTFYQKCDFSEMLAFFKENKAKVNPGELLDSSALKVMMLDALASLGHLDAALEFMKFYGVTPSQDMPYDLMEQCYDILGMKLEVLRQKAQAGEVYGQDDVPTITRATDEAATGTGDNVKNLPQPPSHSPQDGLHFGKIVKLDTSSPTVCKGILENEEGKEEEFSIAGTSYVVQHLRKGRRVEYVYLNAESTDRKPVIMRVLIKD